MATMPKILVEVGPQGLGDILIGAEAPAARSRALRFLAGKMESLSRLDKDLRKPYSSWTKIRVKATGRVIDMAPLVAKAMVDGGTAELV